MAEAVYRGGGDDATIGSRDGQVFVHFDRQANSLDEAIVTAAAVLRSAGLRTSRLTIDAEELTDLLAPTTAD